VNPKSATHLKMVGGPGSEKIAERLGKPASDTVVGGVGAAGRFPGEQSGEPSRDEATPSGRTWTSLTASVEGARNSKRGAERREARGRDFGSSREGDPNPMRGKPRESRPGARSEDGIPGGSDACERRDRAGGE
jgi:hypothetical protein